MMGRNKAVLVAGIAALLMIGGISVMSIEYAKNGEGKRAGLIWGGRAKLRNVIELPLSETESLTLEYGSKNIKVYPSDSKSSEDRIIIEEYLYCDDPEAMAVVSNPAEKEVLVTGGRGVPFVIFGFMGGEGERIEVYIPSESLKQLSLQGGSGNITSETNCIRPEGSLAVKAGSGNIRWKNAEGKRISFHTGSGNLHVENIRGEMKIHTGSGNITGKRIEGSAEADAGSGNIKLEDFAGCGRVKTNSGNVTVKAAELTGDMALQAGSGNVKLELTAGIPFRFEAETGSGNITTNFEEKLSYNKRGNHAEGNVGENPSVKVEAKAGSGNVGVKVQPR